MEIKPIKVKGEPDIVTAVRGAIVRSSLDPFAPWDDDTPGRLTSLLLSFLGRDKSKDQKTAS